MPIADGPMCSGLPAAMAAMLAMTAGTASCVSITEPSSAACTIGVVVQVTPSTVAMGGGFRFSSVK
jgi:hypothetical protein